MGFELRAKRRVLHPEEPPRGVHHFSFSRFGGEIMMEVGFFDMARLVREIDEAKQAHDKKMQVEVEVTVFAQYSMAADTFLRLRQNVEHIYQALKDSGELAEIPGEEK